MTMCTENCQQKYAYASWAGLFLFVLIICGKWKIEKRISPFRRICFLSQPEPKRTMHTEIQSTKEKKGKITDSLQFVFFCSLLEQRQKLSARAHTFQRLDKTFRRSFALVKESNSPAIISVILLSYLEFFISLSCKNCLNYQMLLLIYLQNRFNIHCCATIHTGIFFLHFELYSLPIFLFVCLIFFFFVFSLLTNFFCFLCAMQRWNQTSTLLRLRVEWNRRYPNWMCLSMAQLD